MLKLWTYNSKVYELNFGSVHHHDRFEMMQINSLTLNFDSRDLTKINSIAHIEITSIFLYKRLKHCFQRDYFQCLNAILCIQGFSVVWNSWISPNNVVPSLWCSARPLCAAAFGCCLLVDFWGFLSLHRWKACSFEWRSRDSLNHFHFTSLAYQAPGLLLL